MSFDDGKNLADFLECARIRSKEFYIKATNIAMLDVHEYSKQAINAVMGAMQCLENYAQSGTLSARMVVAEASRNVAALTEKVSTAAKEAEEAASLALSVELMDNED
ncbi:MAG: hypothetical protein RR632_03145 [Christensenella sp.]